MRANGHGAPGSVDDVKARRGVGAERESRLQSRASFMKSSQDQPYEDWARVFTLNPGCESLIPADVEMLRREKDVHRKASHDNRARRGTDELETQTKPPPNPEPPHESALNPILHLRRLGRHREEHSGFWQKTLLVFLSIARINDRCGLRRRNAPSMGQTR